MEKVVIPNIEEEASRIRATDELPHSGAGKTITTIEPKFVPNEAVNIHVAKGLTSMSGWWTASDTPSKGPKDMRMKTVRA